MLMARWSQAVYRFLLNDPVRFSRSLKARISYEHEIKNQSLRKAREEGNGEVAFGIVVYWYQEKPADAAVV